MTPEAASTDRADMSIDDIARAADLPSSTVRMYQNKGLLPPPIKRGRVGYYGTGHQERLRLIAHLQERGFSLAGIKELLDAWDSGQGLDQLLGINDLAPSLAHQPLRLSPIELQRRFKGIKLTASDINRARKLGLIELDGVTIVVRHEAFVEIGPAIARLGIPVGEILDEYEALTDNVAVIADRFKAVFETHIWEPFEKRGFPAEDIPDITANIEQLTELATRVVAGGLHDQFATFAMEYLDRAQSANRSQLK